MTRKEKLAKRKSLFSLARYLVSKSKRKIEKLEGREHDRQVAKEKAANPVKEDKKLKQHPWMKASPEEEVVEAETQEQD